MIGTTLSHYRITGELGRGGMGIVYQAEDTKLDRTVAIKILPSAALASSDDRERFYREAKSAAQLHHPNIASVFEIDEAVPEGGDAAEPRPFIAMEYIAGGTLQDKIKEKPLSLPDAVKIASQVAEALKAAHAKDIVHRDIKSANVMITEDGIAKVLDFGLAKTNQSTMLTRMGSTLGTVAYMSPEQARGQEVDGRTDLYSLGTMLYEMVAGRLPFAGEYEQAVVYSILNEPPEPLTSLRTGVPMQLEWIVNKLLAKDAEYRYQTAADLLADLKTLDLSGSGMSRRSMPAMSGAAIPVASEAGARQPSWMWPTVVVIVALVAAIGAWMLKPVPSSSEDPTIRTEIDLGTEVENTSGIAISHSGRLLAVSENFQRVRIRNLETGEDWLIPESDRVVGLSFNDDETWLLLERPGRIDRVQVRGSRPVPFADPSSQWASPRWTPDNGVLFEDHGSLWVQSLSGGAAREFAPGDSTRRFDDPSISPDGRYVLSQVIMAEEDRIQLGVFSYPDGEWLGDLDLDVEAPEYVDTGHILFASPDGILAVAANLDPPELLGAPVPLFEGTTTWRMSLTDSGHLFLGYGSSTGNSGDYIFGTYIFEGSYQVSPAASAGYDYFTVAPTPPLRVATEASAEGGGESLWVVNLESGVSNRLTFGDVGDNPWWHPSGDSVLYVSRMNQGPSELIMHAADGSGAPRVLYNHPVRMGWPSATADFSKVAFASNDGDSDIWLLDVATGEAHAIIDEDGRQDQPRISPDGRFLTFVGDQVGNESRVYMQAVEGPARFEISKSMGFDSAWSQDGRFIFYQSPNGIFRVEVSTEGGRISISNPEQVAPATRTMFPLPDGSGVVLTDDRGLDSPEASTSSKSRFIDVRFNWKKELLRLVPRAD